MQLDFGKSFSRVFDLYTKHFVQLITYSAIFYGVLSLIWVVFIAAFSTSVAAAALIGLINIVLTMVASILIAGAYIVGVDDAERTGTFPPFGEVWPRLMPRFGALVVTSILSGLGILAGMILLVVPGLVLATWWFVAAPVVMLEDKSGAAALGRSRELVSGNGWTVFGLFFVMAILVGIAGSILGGIVGTIFSFNEYAELFTREFVPGVLTGPLSALLAIVVYLELTGGGQQPPQHPQPPLHGESPLPPLPQDPPTPPTPPTPPNDGPQGPFV